ncbi:unnamed protein product [Adineta ricciae]|uniref:DUF6970 domain-containing protein n=1 Tax=Adineta ricciae TaxID=249248 RepID=A0A814NMM8_ADIRI|nr:unnamed protein product [Adineta ricciae]
MNMKTSALPIILYISFVLISLSTQAKVPHCIQKRINAIAAQPVWNPPATVYEYVYQNKRTFLFSSNCCDQFNELYDEECNRICAPSGGFTGRGDGKCPDFATTAKIVGKVWQDPRTRG